MITTKWLENLTVHAAPIHYPAGVTLHPQGVPVREVYAVRQGLVKLTCLNDNGQQTILGVRARGWLSGGTAAALGDFTLSATVTVTPCELLRLPAPRFLSLLRNEMPLAWQWQQMQSLDNQCQQRLTIALRCFNAQQRLEHALWHLIVTQRLGNENIKLQLPLPNQDFAALLDITPAFLARCITRLESEGKLRRHHGWLIVERLDNLWHMQQWDFKTGLSANPLNNHHNTDDDMCFLI